MLDEREPCPVCDQLDCTEHGTPLDPAKRAFQEWGKDAVPRDEPATIIAPYDVHETVPIPMTRRTTRRLVARAGQPISVDDARRLGVPLRETQDVRGAPETK